MRKTAIFGTLSMVLALGLAPAAADAGVTIGYGTPAEALTVSSLPSHTAQEGTLGDLWAPPATDAANMAVADACVPGSQLAAPHWVLLAPPTAGKAVIRAKSYRMEGRGRVDIGSGVAVVSRNGKKVLACATDPSLSDLGARRIGTEGVYVVAFQVAQEPPEGEEGELPGGYERYLSLYIDSTTGLPPRNDNMANATMIDAVPFTDTADRYFASGEAVDIGWVGGNFCGDSVGGRDHVLRSVWYRLIPAEDIMLDGSSGPRLAIDGAAQIAEVTPDGLMSRDCSQDWDRPGP